MRGRPRNKTPFAYVQETLDKLHALGPTAAAEACARPRGLAVPGRDDHVARVMRAAAMCQARRWLVRVAGTLQHMCALSP